MQCLLRHSRDHYHHHRNSQNVSMLRTPPGSPTDLVSSTVVVLQTTYQTFQQQVTVPVGTTTLTTTVPNTLAGPTFRKRQEGITPAAAVFSQFAEATGLNASLIHSVSSACSCLFITEKVNVVVTTSTEVRPYERWFFYMF